MCISIYSVVGTVVNDHTRLGAKAATNNSKHRKENRTGKRSVRYKCPNWRDQEWQYTVDNHSQTTEISAPKQPPPRNWNADDWTDNHGDWSCRVSPPFGWLSWYNSDRNG